MQLASAGFTREDLAKYPFLKQASSEIQDLQLTIKILVNEDRLVLERAQERVENAILNLNTGDIDRDRKKEIASFAASLILVIATKKPWIKKRYALAVAKTAYTHMLSQDTTKEKVAAIARDFDWDIAKGTADTYMYFGVGFTFYLKNAAHLHGSSWKLTNQIIDAGRVYLNQTKVVRLLQEEIRNKIEKRLEVSDLKNLPEDVNIIANKLTELAQGIMGQETEDMPKIVVQAAFPPCVNALYAEAAAAHHLSHVGRFTLTSFLLNIGMSHEAVNEMYKTFSDCNERLTRNQIEHIAGERGFANSLYSAAVFSSSDSWRVQEPR